MHKAGQMRDGVACWDCGKEMLPCMKPETSEGSVLGMRIGWQCECGRYQAVQDRMDAHRWANRVLFPISDSAGNRPAIRE